MKKHSLLLLFLLLTGVVFAQQKHVILISIDGFRPDFYRDKNWPAPTLQRLAAEGVQAIGVQSVFPSLTYPSHTSIITGALPIHHGIYFNNVFEGKEGQGIWNDSLIKVPTIWSALHKAGLKSASVMWPVTVGAPIDYNFPIRRAEEDEQSDQIAMTRPYITPESLFDAYEQANGKLDHKDFGENKNAQDSTVEKMAMYVFNTYKPALTAFHFLSMDHAQHAFGRDGKEVRQSLTVVDGLIARVFKDLKASGMDKSTTVIITGDHGFVNTVYSFSPNVLLAKNGLIHGKEWKAKFNSAGGSEFLYVKNNDPQVLKRVMGILDSLPADQRKLFRMINRTQMDSVGANADAMMALALNKGIKGTNKATGDLFQPTNRGGNHGNFPDFQEIQTGFIAIGPDVETGKIIPQMGVINISPIIAALLHVPFTAPDGKLINGVIKETRK